MITSNRLTIRPLSTSDWPFIVELLNQPDFINNIGDKNVRDKESACHYLEQGPMKMQADYGYSLMAMVLKNGQLVGLCGLLKRDNLPYPDLGYALLADYYRQGFTYEAAQAILAHFHAVRPVLAITSPENIASQQLLAKLNFKQVVNINNEDKEQLSTFRLD